MAKTAVEAPNGQLYVPCNATQITPAAVTGNRVVAWAAHTRPTQVLLVRQYMHAFHR